MLLNVFERLLLRNIVPQIQGVSFGIQENARILLETMFTEDEAEKLQIKINEDGKGVTWKVKDDEGNDIPQEKECQVSKGVKRVVAEELIRLSESKPPKLSWEHNTLFKKFVDDWEKHLEKDEPAP
jgi:hypothetical protein